MRMGVGTQGQNTYFIDAVRRPRCTGFASGTLVENVPVLCGVRMKRERSADESGRDGHLERPPRLATVLGQIMLSALGQNICLE